VNFTDRTAEAVFAEAGDRADYSVGTMIESVSCRPARRGFAEHAEFQLRHQRPDPDHLRHLACDDSGRFCGGLYDKGIFETDPLSVSTRRARRPEGSPRSAVEPCVPR
jgi:pyruvate,orthophosphate dikinase